MDNFSAKVKDAFDQSLPKEAYLSEQEKQRIRNQIQTIRKEQPKKKRDLLPKTLTAIVAAGILLFLGGVIEKNLNQPSTEQTGDKGDSASAQKNTEENDIFSKFDVGDVVNGWTLVRKGPNYGVSNNPSGLWLAEFTSSQIITGKLVYNDENNQYEPNTLVFFPNENAKKALPILDQQKEKVYMKFSDQFAAEKILGIQPGEERNNISIEVDHYTFNYKQNLVVPDTIHLVNLIGADGKEVIQETKLRVDEAGHVQLPNRLLKVYSILSRTRQTAELKGLSPFDIFQLYYYMEDQQDYPSQYALFIDDPEYVPTFKTVDEYVKAKSQPDDQKGQRNLLEMIKSAHLQENITTDTNAHITISKEIGLGFSLTKNKKGIWKVNWMPLQ